MNLKRAYLPPVTVNERNTGNKRQRVEERNAENLVQNGFQQADIACPSIPTSGNPQRISINHPAAFGSSASVLRPLGDLCQAQKARPTGVEPTGPQGVPYVAPQPLPSHQASVTVLRVPYLHPQPSVSTGLAPMAGTMPQLQPNILPPGISRIPAGLVTLANQLAHWEQRTSVETISMRQEFDRRMAELRALSGRVVQLQDDLHRKEEEIEGLRKDVQSLKEHNQVLQAELVKKTRKTDERFQTVKKNLTGLVELLDS